MQTNLLLRLELARPIIFEKLPAHKIYNLFIRIYLMSK